MANTIQLNVVQGAQPTSSGTVVKDILGATAGFAAISYVLGFIIVNSFFKPYGVIPLALISTKYLAAGLGFAFFYAIVAVFFAAFRHVSFAEEWPLMIARREQAVAEQSLKLKAKSQSYATSYARWYRRTFAIGHFVRYLVTILIRHLGYYVPFALIMAPVLYLSGSSLRILARSAHIYIWIYVVTVGFSLAKDFANQGKGARWTLLPLVLILFLISAMWYGQYIYGDVSYSIGGGAPQEVEFITEAPGKDAIKAYLGGASEQQSSPTYSLIMETSDTFMIIMNVNGVERLISLKKELVEGVIYKRRP